MLRSGIDDNFNDLYGNYGGREPAESVSVGPRPNELAFIKSFLTIGKGEESSFEDLS